jgi:hypothetical protein
LNHAFRILHVLFHALFVRVFVNDNGNVNVVVCMHAGDALEHATRGLFKATPHRVQQRLGVSAHRVSMPYFFDPCFDCEMLHVVGVGGDIDPDTDTDTDTDTSNRDADAATDTVDTATGTAAGIGRGAAELQAGVVLLQEIVEVAGTSTTTTTAPIAATALGEGRKVEGQEEGAGAGGGGLYSRWDGADPTMFTGTYGKYVLRKVSKAFPALFQQQIGATASVEPVDGV